MKHLEVENLVTGSMILYRRDNELIDKNFRTALDNTIDTLLIILEIPWLLDTLVGT